MPGPFTRTLALAAASGLAVTLAPLSASAQDDISDPASWEAFWSQDGSFTGVSCVIDHTGGESVTLSQEPPAGQRWFLAALLNNEGMRTEYGIPQVGDTLVLFDESTADEDDTTAFDSQVLCSADPESRGFSESEGEPGPVVETDEPASGAPVPALVVGLGMAVLAGAAVLLGSRRPGRR